MWIKDESESTKRMYNDEIMDEYVEFSDNGTAQVSEDVGEAMVERYDNIVEYQKD